MALENRNMIWTLNMMRFETDNECTINHDVTISYEIQILLGIYKHKLCVLFFQKMGWIWKELAYNTIRGR